MFILAQNTTQTGLTFVQLSLTKLNIQRQEIIIKLQIKYQIKEGKIQ